MEAIMKYLVKITFVDGISVERTISARNEIGIWRQLTNTTFNAKDNIYYLSSSILKYEILKQLDEK